MKYRYGKKLLLVLAAGILLFASAAVRSKAAGQDLEAVESALPVQTEHPQESQAPAVTEDPEAVFETLFFGEDYFAPIHIDEGPLRLVVDEFQGLACQWRADTPEYALIDERGIITPVAPGLARFHVIAATPAGKNYEYDIPIFIVDPSLDRTSFCLAKGCVAELKILDASSNPPEVSTSDSDIVKIVSNRDGIVEVKACAGSGKATITILADRVTLECQITVSNPQMKGKYGFYEKNKSFAVKVTGLNKKSDVTWASSNKKVAKVSSKGRVEIKKLGSATISCEADGKTMLYYLAVGRKTVVKAMKWGFKKVGKCHYSQACRMSRTLFDCSSFVYRCYRAAGKYLVRRTSWAPVAAEIGQYYVGKKKQIQPTGAYYAPEKLLPGDLVCYGGKYASRNGRYKRIYHIVMYIGNGLTMESSSSSNNVVIKERGIIYKRYVPVVVRPV